MVCCRKPGAVVRTGLSVGEGRSRNDSFVKKRKEGKDNILKKDRKQQTELLQNIQKIS